MKRELKVHNVGLDILDPEDHKANPDEKGTERFFEKAWAFACIRITRLIPMKRELKVILTGIDLISFCITRLIPMKRELKDNKFSQSPNCAGNHKANPDEKGTESLASAAKKERFAKSQG